MPRKCSRSDCIVVLLVDQRASTPCNVSWTISRGIRTCGSVAAWTSRGIGSRPIPTQTHPSSTIMADTTRTDLSRRYTNVADARLGAVALFATDEFFAAKERMLQPNEPEWRAGFYDEHGKWMDGWESRRRRDQGHDHCIVKLGAPSILAALEIDTRHFTGNYPPFASVQACRIDGGDPDANTHWSVLLPQSPVAGNQQNLYTVQSNEVWTHLKL